MNADHPWAIAHEGIPGIVIEDPAAVHYHGDPTSAFPGTSCDRCVVDFARDFLAKTAAQKGSFLTPAPADYLACDRTLNEERERLRWEYLALHPTTLMAAAIKMGLQVPPGTSDAATTDALIDAMVDRVCPRAWLDRRLKEVL